MRRVHLWKKISYLIKKERVHTGGCALLAMSSRIWQHTGSASTPCSVHPRSGMMSQSIIAHSHGIVGDIMGLSCMHGWWHIIQKQKEWWKKYMNIKVFKKREKCSATITKCEHTLKKQPHVEGMLQIFYMEALFVCSSSNVDEIVRNLMLHVHNLCRTDLLCAF